MKLSAFSRFVSCVAANAGTYRTKTACELMLARVKAAYVRCGSYGCLAGGRALAISALQDRWVELDCDEREAWQASVGA